MKATREWGLCSCNCGKNISPGDEFIVIDGSMYLLGHEERRTRQIPAVKREPIASSTAKSKKKKKQHKKDAEELSLFDMP